MRFKKYICFLLAAVIVFSFAGCKESSEQTSFGETVVLNSEEYAESLDLLYNLSDTFNPYSAETELNRQLCRLLYEPLVKTDNKFQPVNRLAESIELSGNKCTVRIRNAVFSDGSNVTASDVVHSFNLAKASTSYYSSKLSVAQSAAAADSKTVVFTLAKQNPYFSNLLDFPVLKAGSEQKTDSDGVVLPPIGCGRYYVNNERNAFVLNDKFYGEKGIIKKINLINAPDKESITHYVEIGAADIYYSDAADGNIIRMSAKKFDINLNNLVYIGINDSYGELSNRYLRYALSSALDRKQICTTSYYNNALAATGFFNPEWEEVKSVQNIQTSANSEITVENLEKIGYNSLNGSSQRVNKNGNALQFTLLVNIENSMRVAAAKQIASQLKQFGITVTVIETGYADYINRLTTGNFQLYLGEIAVTPDMDLSSLVVSGGSAAYGVGAAAAKAQAQNSEEASSEAPSETEQEQEEQQPASVTDVINGFYSGKNTITDVSNILQAEMPVIPVCYRTGVLFCNEKIENINNPSLSDIYFSIEGYKIKK